jgi:hypothetical protein
MRISGRCVERAHNIVYSKGINAIARSILDINPIFDDIDR